MRGKCPCGVCVLKTDVRTVSAELLLTSVVEYSCADSVYVGVQCGVDSVCWVPAYLYDLNLS